MVQLAPLLVIPITTVSYKQLVLLALGLPPVLVLVVFVKSHPPHILIILLKEIVIVQERTGAIPNVLVDTLVTLSLFAVLVLG